jgi:Lrp/AsnC family transcriptional regulator, regulator for asnA, asnC and gidA
MVQSNICEPTYINGEISQMEMIINDKLDSIKLDKVDKNIIRLLQESPRRTNSNIATKSGVSESTVKNRINRLAEKRILKTYAILNPAAFGYHSIFSVGFQVESGKRDMVVKNLKKLKEVAFIGCTIGRYDIIADIRLSSPERLLDLVIKTGKRIPGVVSTKSFYILDIKLDHYKWKLPGGSDDITKTIDRKLSDNNDNSIELTKKIQIDKTDCRIIKLLQQNGRTNNAEISREIDLSKTTIKNRLDKLTNHNVLKFVAVLNPRAAGYQVSVFIELKVDPKELDTIGDELSRYKEVVYLAFISGSFDIVIETLFLNTSDLHHFVINIMEQIQGVEQYEIIHLVDTIMMEYEWKLPTNCGNTTSHV